MIADSRWRGEGVALSIAGILAVASLAAGGLAVAERDRAPGASLRVSRGLDDRGLSTQLAVVAEATASQDRRQAMRAWRDAYPIALASRRWEAMSAMGDAAVKIDAIPVPGEERPAGFKSEARRAYLEALSSARSAGSSAGIQRVADGFTSLGDAETASRIRALLVSR